MPELVQFPLEAGGSVTVEVGRLPSGTERVGRGEHVVHQMATTFDAALAEVRDAAAAALAQFQRMPTRPDEVEIAFGVKLDARLGAVVAEAGVEGNLQVTVKWVNRP